MRIFITLCFLFISAICFSQIDDLIRKSEYEVRTETSHQDKPQLCGMRGTLGTTIELPQLPKPVLSSVISTTTSFLKRSCSPVEDTVPIITVKKIDTVLFVTGSIFNPGPPPLIVIDAVAFNDEEGKQALQKLDPNDIESVYVLKNEKAVIIYGCIASGGLILITTKKSYTRTFIIRDFLDGSKIAGASVSFTSVDKKDTIMLAANDSGVVVTDKLKPSGNYQLNVSAVGFKTFSQEIKNLHGSKEKEILLEREIRTCDNVIITTGHVGRKISCSTTLYCLVSGITIGPVKKELPYNTIAALKTFPNPVQRGGTVTIAFTAADNESLTIKLLALNGQPLASTSQLVYKGTNQVSLAADPRWAAGIYVIQVYAKGKLLASNKVIIQ